jgi:translation initiation factor IF-2
MAKMRIYQLAKELQVQSALIIEVLDRMGQEVRSDLSTLDQDVTEKVRTQITKALDVEKQRLAKEQATQPEAPAVAEQPEASETPEPVAAATDTPAETDATPAEEPAVAPAAATADPPAAARPAEAPGRPAAPGKRGPRVFPARRIPPPSMFTRPRPGSAPPGTAPGAPGPGGLPGPPARPGMGRPAPLPPGRAHQKRRKKKGKGARQQVAPVVAKPRDLPPVPEAIQLSEGVTVKELAEKLNRKSKDVIAKLIPRGILATINHPLEPDVAIDVAKDFGSVATVLTFEEEAQQSAKTADGVDEAALDTPTDDAADLVPRAPIVTVMGHVDHGKTSLLDAYRKTNVADREAGGITQHIGAYQVEIKGRKITFLDTPGHEAFTVMRARGAQSTDIVVLVVAADDGVKPQTQEAIDHARAAGVPLVVAINKIDKSNAQPERVKQQLADKEILIEEYGGEIVCCEVSAKQRTGLDELLEMILLTADVHEFKANPNKAATGTVLEARRDRARGVVATVLVKSGTLKAGDPFIAGAVHGKVRAMVDEHGKRIKKAEPSMPVEVMGFAEEPEAGDAFQAVDDESKARQIASFRQDKLRAEKQKQTARRTLESISSDIASGAVKELTVVIRADVQGSIEALRKSVSDLPDDKVKVRIQRAAIGSISQADVIFAAASSAIIIGFNIRPDRVVADLARDEGVEIRSYTVIYDMLDDIRKAMVGMLEPTFKENVLGQAEVRQLFKVPKMGVIAGCYVTDGKVTRGAEVRLLRDNVVIYTGKVGSLRRFKDDASEVKQGYECGIGIAGYNDLKESDIIEFFEMVAVAVKSL